MGTYRWVLALLEMMEWPACYVADQATFSEFTVFTHPEQVNARLQSDPLESGAPTGAGVTPVGAAATTTGGTSGRPPIGEAIAEDNGDRIFPCRVQYYLLAIQPIRVRQYP